MVKSIYCVKLQQESAAMPKPPFPGELGLQIFSNISQKAWDQWLVHQTMLINEYRLNLMEISARDFLRTELQKYFFGEGSSKPAGFKEL